MHDCVCAYLQMNAVRILQENFGVGWLAGVVNGVVINVFNALYGWLAKALTEWENHRTQTEYLRYAANESATENHA